MIRCWTMIKLSSAVLSSSNTFIAIALASFLSLPATSSLASLSSTELAYPIRSSGSFFSSTIPLHDVPISFAIWISSKYAPPSAVRFTTTIQKDATSEGTANWQDIHSPFASTTISTSQRGQVEPVREVLVASMYTSTCFWYQAHVLECYIIQPASGVYILNRYTEDISKPCIRREIKHMVVSIDRIKSCFAIVRTKTPPNTCII